MGTKVILNMWLQEKQIELLNESTWYLDSGCSKHMIGNIKLLSEVFVYQGPRITFGECKTVDKGKIIYENIIMNEVFLVENLRYNLISINQLCDGGDIVEFHK